MITLQVRTIEEYLELREKYPSDWFQAIPAPASAIPAPRPPTGAKGKFETLYNSPPLLDEKGERIIGTGFGKGFRFTKAQEHLWKGKSQSEISALRESLCEKCLATKYANGESEESAKAKPAQGETPSNEVEPDEEMF